MQPTVGEIVEGKITGITKFGAFVSLPEGKNGLVHISEIANSYVNSVSDHVSEGQAIKVKIIGVSPDGRINLSIKQALPPPPRVSFSARESAARSNPGKPSATQPAIRRQVAKQPDAEPSFEDKLKQFMHDSDNRISDSRIYSDKKSGYRRKKD